MLYGVCRTAGPKAIITGRFPREGGNGKSGVKTKNPSFPFSLFLTFHLFCILSRLSENNEIDHGLKGSRHENFSNKEKSCFYNKRLKCQGRPELSGNHILLRNLSSLMDGPCGVVFAEFIISRHIKKVKWFSSVHLRARDIIPSIFARPLRRPMLHRE